MAEGDIRLLLRCFHEIGQAVISQTPLNEALVNILRAIVPLLPDTKSSIMLREPGRDELITVATHGLGDEELRLRFRLGEGIAGWVAEHGKTVVSNEPERDPRFLPNPARHRPLAGLMSLPLFSMGQLVGVLNLHSGDRRFDEADVDLAELLATLISANIQRHRLEHLSLTDTLTGVGNRRCFDSTLSQEMSRAARYKSPLSLVSFDLDRLKQLNDTHGHAAGDSLLRQIGHLVHATIRQPDCVCRIGGDEFMAILPETRLEGALVIAERLRAGIDACRTEGSVHVTGSFGVTSVRPNESADAFMKRADELLYRAKREGGNRVLSG